MIKNRFLLCLALLFAVILPTHLSAQVTLFEQLLSSTNTLGYPSFVNVPVPSTDRFVGDDFTTNNQTWDISTIFIPGNFRAGGGGWADPGPTSTLLNATMLHWEIWANNAGVPAGIPGIPPIGTPLWSLSAEPDDPRVTIENGSGGYGSNVTLTLAEAYYIRLTPPDTYWLVFYPEIDATTYARWGRQVSDTTNGFEAQLISPEGGPPWDVWTPLNTVYPAELGDIQDLAFRLEGFVAAPNIAVSPAGPINFTTTQVGQTSAATEFAISNTGTLTATVSSIAIAGTDNTQFSVVVGGSNACASLNPTLAAGEGCTVNVTFAPTTAGPKTALLRVASNAPQVDVTLNGTGQAPGVSVSPLGPINFTTTQVGQTSAATQVTITNTGVGPLNVSGIAIAGGDSTQFAVAVGGGVGQCATLTPTIAVGANCWVNVTFAPTSAGAKTSTLQISSNAPQANVTLNGTGQAPGVSVSPLGPINFTTTQVGQTSAATQVTITNTGVGPLNVSGIAIAGGDSTQFAVAVGGGVGQCATLTPTIAVGANCWVNVTFAPTSAGAKTSTLQISSNAPQANVTLNGTGQAPGVSVSPLGPINFGSIKTSLTSTPTQVTITNTGVGPLVVSGITLVGTNPGDFGVATGGTRACASLTPTIPASDYCTVNVTFTPTSVGNKAASLAVTSNASPASVTLEGIGIDPNISVAPVGPIDFGAVLISQTSPATEVTISNTGTTPLVVGSIAIGGTDATQFAVAVGGTNACASLAPTIAAGENCTVNVTFTPTSIAAKTAAVNIASNDGETPTAIVTLNGNGINPGISIAPIGPINFDPLLVGDTSPATEVTISNTGTTPLVVGSIAIGGTDATQFAVAVGGTNACASLAPTIAAGENCTVNVTFTPTSTGAKTAALNVTSNVSPASVTLNGTGMPAELAPVEGTIGTEIVIEGADFGTKKGKVLVGDVAAKKAVTTKIAKDAWTEGMITCSVTKVPKTSPGTFDITIQAKSAGATSVTLSNAFTVRLPAPDALTGANDNGAQGANINLTGDFFGTKKGKVYLTYRNSRGQDKQKSCKTVSWGMNAITFQVPKLDPGIYPLSITNKVGNVLVGSFTITN